MKRLTTVSNICELQNSRRASVRADTGGGEEIERKPFKLYMEMESAKEDRRKAACSALVIG